MIKGAIFDMDGTLVDNTPVHIRAIEIFCERYGIRDWKEKLGQAYGMGNDDIMKLIMPAEVIREKGLAALAEEKESIYREIYAPEIVPMPGLTDLLQRLRDAGIRCAVGSSGYKPNVDFVLEKCRIEPYFDARISGDMVSRCKPDPEIYLTAAAALGLTAAECVVFEDAPAGIEAARRAGAGHIVALATTLDRAALAQPAADRVIDDFRDITAHAALLKYPGHSGRTGRPQFPRLLRPGARQSSSTGSAPPQPGNDRAAANRQHRRSQGIRMLPAAGRTHTHRTPDTLSPSR